MARKLEVQIVGDASSLKRALGDAEGHTNKFGNALGGIAKAGVLAAGAAGVGGLFVTLKAGIDDFKESARVSAQTEAVIKSTGGSAKITAGEVGKLAESISAYSGVDDEAIQAGENMLLTFTNIRNEAGKGNDVFNQSTAILADMSVALGTDMSKSAIQLGKALNDPIAGVSALSRVGVTFTDSQKAAIKAMVDAGNTAGAQKLILAELTKEFGGSAKAAGDTLPGQLDKLKNAFGNMSGELVGAAVPALTSFVEVVADKGLPALGRLFDAIQNAAGPAIDAIADAFKDAGPQIRTLMDAFGEIAGVVVRVVTPVFEGVVKVIRDDLAPIFNRLREIAVEAVGAISEVLQRNEPELKRIFENVKTLVENVGEAMKTLGKVVVPILDFAFTTVLPTAIRVLLPVLKVVSDAIAALSTVAEKTIGAIITVFTEGPAKIKNAFVDAWNTVKGGITGAFDAVRTHVAGLPGRIANIFGDIPGAVAAELKGKAGDLWNAVKGIFDKLPGFVKKALGISSPSRVFHGIGTSIMDGAIKGIKDKAGDLLDAAWGAFTSIGGKVAGAAGGALDAVMGGQGLDLIAAGRYLQSVGFQVGEHPYFGGVAPVHAPNSYHYKGRAIDVNWPGGGSAELAHLRGAYRFLSSLPHVELMIEDIGRQNQHLHFAMNKGGVFTKPTTGVFSVAESGPEAFVPLDRYGGFGTQTQPIVVHVHGSVMTERDLAIALRDELERHGDRNSGIGWSRPS